MKNKKGKGLIIAIIVVILLIIIGIIFLINQKGERETNRDCNNLEGAGADRCYAQEAIRTGVVDLCFNIEDDGLEGECISRVDSSSSSSNVEVPAGVFMEKDLVFCSMNGLDLELDLAYPENGNGAGIIFVHGGGFSGGDRYRFSETIIEAAEKGYFAATIEYRLIGPNGEYGVNAVYPDPVEDISCAIRWLKTNAEDYEIDKERIGLMGTSSGGHLVMMAGLAPELFESGEHLGESNNVKTVVDWFGISDMELLYDLGTKKDKAEALMGGSPSEIPDLYFEASPVNHLDSEDPSLLVQHGDRDKVVDVQHAELLEEKIIETGADGEVIIYSGEPHGLNGVEEEAWKKVWEWFAAEL